MKGILVCLFFLIRSLSFAQTNSQQSIDELNSPEVFGDITNCRELVNSGKSQSEKDELQKDYWILLGIVSDLQKYQQLFLTKGELINLFPSAYFHTTFSEMKNIVSGKYHYPVEKMKQMISFYDAYKVNRNYWDKGDISSVEIHWREHFEYSKKWNSSTILCTKLGDVLTSATKAHILYDLPRAIRYAAANRFDKSIPFQQYNNLYYPEFKTSDILFGKTMDYTVHDISTAHPLCIEWILKKISTTTLGNFIINSTNELGLTSTLNDVDVIELRHNSWKNAFSNYPLFGPKENILKNQPTINHATLTEIGKKLCPAETKSDTTTTSKPASPQINSSITGQHIGGATPEELGKILLKALKTNDKKLWVACFTPKEVWTQEAFKVEYDGQSFYSSRLKFYTERFDYLREKLEENGFANLVNIKFSRVRFKRVERKKDNYVVEGESLIEYFYIEFSYGTEFLGQIGDMNLATYKKGNYFVASQGGLLEAARY